MPQLSPLLVSTANASTQDTGQLLVKKVVLAWLSHHNKLELNITEIDKYINLTNTTTASCNCTACSTHTGNLNISIQTLYKYNTSKTKLIFLSVTLHNETISHQYYVLLYGARHKSYDAVITTTITVDPDTGKYLSFKTYANIVPNGGKSLSVANAVLILNETTLS